ncbi:hypothetical protein HN385_00095 [archaeon]|jgi:hypothetical protein|nr:hypothetical protein [archaeon]MBT3450842.1 hypothetical protein [archaeon]MBT6869027.1 hypothetical protein [archaeon]MBT7193615.1 hypothetical protein [archaeon]MBT7380148.1 hypothetical protein [archaeon]
MKSQENDFYQTVLELGHNPGRRSVINAYRVGIREAQSIADKVCDAYSTDDFIDLKKEYITLRRAYVAGLSYFVKYGVQKDLDILMLNTVSMIHMRSGLIRNEEFYKGIQSIAESEKKRKQEESKDEELDTESNLVN